MGLVGLQHEAHAEDDRALEGLPGVGGEAMRRADDRTRLGEERRDPRDRLLIENEWRGPAALPQPDMGDFEARRARPLAAGDRPGDDAAVGRQLVETDLSGIALGDGVRGQEAALTALSQQPSARRKK